MRWNIIGDSSCDLFDLETPAEDITYRSVPFLLNIENTEFVDDENLDTQQMVKIMKESKKASSSACPSPESWKEKMTEKENKNGVCKARFYR